MLGPKQARNTELEIHFAGELQKIKRKKRGKAQFLQTQPRSTHLPPREPVSRQLEAMGHGANDKLYITHAEHSGGLGQHSASSGFKG